jgi:hypothetical protein
LRLRRGFWPDPRFRLRVASAAVAGFGLPQPLQPEVEMDKKAKTPKKPKQAKTGAKSK